MSSAVLSWIQIASVVVASFVQLFLLWSGAAGNPYVASSMAYLGAVSMLPFAIFLLAMRSTSLRLVARRLQCSTAGALAVLLIQAWMAFDLLARADSMTEQIWAHSAGWLPWVSVFCGAIVGISIWALVWFFRRISARP